MLWTLIGGLFNDLWPYLIAAGAALGGLWGVKRAGRKEAQAEMKEEANEAADDLRARVRDELPERVRKLDDAGYRD